MEAAALTVAVVVMAVVLATYAFQGLIWLVYGLVLTLRGVVVAVGWLLAFLALAVWAVFNRAEAARMWRAAGYRHAAG